MLYWTAPAFTALGAKAPEFERPLLALKFAYSAATWAMVIGL